EGRTATDSADRAAAVLKIETELARASMDRVARRNPNNTYHRMPVSALTTSPEFGWKQYFQTIGLPPIESLNVASPDFVKGLNDTLRTVSLSDLKNYLIWHVLSVNADLLPRAFDLEDFRFNDQVLRGVKDQPARWKRCVDATDRALGEALGQKFVETA